MSAARGSCERVLALPGVSAGADGDVLHRRPQPKSARGSRCRRRWPAASGSSCRTASTASWSCSSWKTWTSWRSGCTGFWSRRPSCATLPAEAGRRRGAGPDHGARRGVRPPRRPDGSRLGLLRQAAASTPGPTRRWWRWRSSASCSPRSRRRSTTSSWTRSSPRRRSIRGAGRMRDFDFGSFRWKRLTEVVADSADLTALSFDSSAQAITCPHRRRHLRRGVPQHLRRGADHGPRPDVARPRRATRRPATRRARSCATARRASIATSAPAATNRSPRPTAGRARSCSSTCRGSARTASRALERALLVRHQPERADLPDDGVLQPARQRRRTSSSAARSRSSATGTSSATSGSAARCGWCRSWAASSSSTGGSATATA